MSIEAFLRTLTITDISTHSLKDAENLLEQRAKSYQTMIQNENIDTQTKDTSKFYLEQAKFETEIIDTLKKFMVLPDERSRIPAKDSSNVQECIQLFVSKEDLDGNEKPAGEEKYSDVLVLRRKRFSQTRSQTKLNTRVDLTINDLNLNDLIDVASESYEGSVASFNLFGVSNRSDMAYSDHSITQGKHPCTNQWHEFNDSSVYSLNNKSRHVPVLFFERNK
ncbi:unnamed protein product [Adineta ricciae]|uniref:ubiquitinyl hydrolase 1 n=1 Tax=Adineta ricciae TaxID=249248 RepID=A0A815VKV3_ADIRI|nr:unnamed protein product [Adineta ricciae]CAF1533602.1 unnamed protein product [Adineta ricciae]